MTATPTVTARRRHLRGSDIISFVAFTGSYTATGDTITAAQLGLNKLDMCQPDSLFMGATHGYFFSIIPTSPDSAGRFASFQLNIADMVLSTGATADLAAGAYPAALTGIVNGIYLRAVGF